MAGLPPRKRIEDVELLRALAHPLRSALLNHLTAVGPRTASECAEAVGSTASNCSWHLRQLAQFGLVERTEGEDGRERPWRARQVGLELGELADDPARRAAQLGVVGATLSHEQELTQRYLDSLDDLDPAWRAATGLNTYALRITPAELTQLTEAIDALVRPFVGAIRTDAPAGARSVHVGLRAFPRIEHSGKAEE
ncbi:ArsR family transcriptional regulator [Amycolatopsis mediterranei S699]|uniref:ArsR family transcriptional regulator n=1 Tax=Amycolatopsis mediterranei (strain S699) TaxID=713604 RepID=A0A9R0UA38_AMYMS|nr:helix-turn-helix domain-containing protein [Amycolatopsis mediterranei]AEK43494.1 ArsR family transcriptional regulator [Amycolatopsis mediterranei S699]AFO78404.1 ArsR family transcriptional regulator [Amycolatopsis mediterranei S699]AGT85532.1 ArsR family transcriptional regulator [Amycolatopsis mediterranei RB]KDO11405.1 ArsR family transcriptional regulator [Amycolatopsis mediterranei]KDU90532.1 ArsR family transcriptional regulator [Amycolatopsis mediterranei]